MNGEADIFVLQLAWQIKGKWTSEKICLQWVNLILHVFHISSICCSSGQLFFGNGSRRRSDWTGDSGKPEVYWFDHGDRSRFCRPLFHRKLSCLIQTLLGWQLPILKSNHNSSHFDGSCYRRRVTVILLLIATFYVNCCVLCNFAKIVQYQVLLFSTIRKIR